MLDLGLALFLALISAGMGWRLLAALHELPAHPLDALALATPLGLGMLALACLVLGQFNWLNLLGLSVVVAVAAELGIRPGLSLPRRFWNHWGRDASAGPAGIMDRIFLAALVLTLGATALASLAPVRDGDALCYHLQVPKVFLIRQGLCFEPDLHETVYPLVTELLYAIALEFRGPVACRCLQWTLGLILAANVTALARPSLGRRAWWAGTLILLVPAVSNGMSAPLNDVALAAFGTAAIFAWTRQLERVGTNATLVAGLLAGLAMGVKYPALVLVGLLVAATLARPLFDSAWRTRRGWARATGLAAGLIGVALATGGVWYLRAYVHTGNPVYPFFRNQFGGNGLDEVLAPVKRPLAVNAWNLATALVPLTLEPHRFDSFAHQFGPIFLLFLPALMLRRSPRRVVSLTALGYAFLVVCMTQRQSMRFLLLALGPMSVGVAYLASTWQQRRTAASRVLLGLLVLVLVLETGVSLARAARAAGVVLGRESFHQFLARCEPTYRVGRWVAGNLPAGARLIGQDHRGFYIPRHYTMELAHRRRTGLGDHGETAQEVVETLQREGFTHLMMCPPTDRTAIEFDPTMGRLLGSWLSSSVPLFREELADADGVVRTYAIYELAEPAVGVNPGESLIR